MRIYLLTVPLSLAIILAAMFLVAFACSTEDKATVVVTSAPAISQGTDAPAQTEEPEATAAPTPDVFNLAIGQSADIGDARVTVNSFRLDAGGQFIKPKAGSVWVVIDATVLNLNSEKSYTVSTVLKMVLRDGEAREYTITFGPTLNGSLDGTMPPSDKLRGEVAFEVPEAATGLQFVYKQTFGEEQARWNLK